MGGVREDLRPVWTLEGLEQRRDKSCIQFQEHRSGCQVQDKLKEGKGMQGLGSGEIIQARGDGPNTSGSSFETSVHGTTQCQVLDLELELRNAIPSLLFSLLYVLYFALI